MADQLPDWLQYRPGREAIQAEVAFAHLIEQLAKRLDDKRPLQSANLAKEHMLPLVGVMMQYMTYQHADDIMYFQKALAEAHRRAAEEQRPEAIVGLDEETADDLLEPLAELREWIAALVAQDTGPDVLSNHVRTTVEAQLESLDAVIETVGDLVVEEEEDEEDEPEPEAPTDEPPITITNKKKQAAAPADEPPLVIR